MSSPQNSLSGLSIHCGSPGLATQTCWTNLTWSYLTKECALNIHQASFLAKFNIAVLVSWMPSQMAFALCEQSQKV